MDNFETILRDMMKNKSSEQLAKEFTNALNKISEEQKKQEKEEKEKRRKMNENITQMYNSLRVPGQKYTFRDAATAAALAFVSENLDCTTEEMNEFRDQIYQNILSFYDIWKEDWASALNRLHNNVRERLSQSVNRRKVKDDDDAAIADFLNDLFM